MSERGTDFEEFVAARSAALMRSAFLLTGDWQHAEDLLQTALLRCYGRWGRIDRPEAYVRRTLVTTVTGWRRRRWRVEVPTGALPDRPTGGEGAGELAVRADLLRLLGELGPRQRAVVVLRFYDDLSEAQVAGLLGVSVGTVKSQTARALAHLRGSASWRAMVEEGSR